MCPYSVYSYSKTAENIFHCPVLLHVIVHVLYFCAYAYGRMTEAEWLISGMLSMCDKRGELDRGETLSLKKKGKRGFTSEEERQMDRDD